MPSDPEYQAIAATFGDQPIAYQWFPNYEVVDPYVDIWTGGVALAVYINGLNIPSNVPLSVVAHSHGGNVVKIASSLLNRQINYLVTLGTPQNWDLPEINPFAIGNNYCEVSSLADWKQVVGASPSLQLYPLGQDQYYAGQELYQEAIDIYYGNYEAALQDAAWAAVYEAEVFYYWMSTKLAWGAWNAIYTDLSHEDLHTAPVWGWLSGDCGLR